MYSGITSARVLDGVLLLYVLQQNNQRPVDWREIFMKQSVYKMQTN